MLSGRQLRLLRLNSNIPKDELLNRLQITENELTIFEYGIEQLPEDLYERWVKILKH